MVLNGGSPARRFIVMSRVPQSLQLPPHHHHHPSPPLPPRILPRRLTAARRCRGGRGGRGRAPSVVLEQLACLRLDVLDGEAEVLEHLLGRTRCAKRPHAEHAVRVLAPPLGRRSLDGEHRHAAREGLWRGTAPGVKALGTRPQHPLWRAAQRTSNWYSSDCLSKSSQEGIDTRRVRTPSSPAAAAMLSCTSEPEATITSSGSSALGGRRTYAPRRTASGDEPARLGTPWRESARTVGVPAAQSARRWDLGPARGGRVARRRRLPRTAVLESEMYEPDTSFASAGRSVSTFKVARRLISASTGCASARPRRADQSYVATKITPTSTARIRIAPSAYP